MGAGEQISHEGCEREPIHVPGSIQPYGLLFVVDQTTDLILQQRVMQRLSSVSADACCAVPCGRCSVLPWQN